MFSYRTVSILLPFTVSLFLSGFSTRFRFLSSPFCFSQFWCFSPFVLRPLSIFPLLFLFPHFFVYALLVGVSPLRFLLPFSFFPDLLFLSFWFFCPLVSSPFCFCLTLWFFSPFSSLWLVPLVLVLPYVFSVSLPFLVLPSRVVCPFTSSLFLIFPSFWFLSFVLCVVVPLVFPFVFLCSCLSLFFSFLFFLLFPNSRTIMWYKNVLSVL